MYQIFSSPRIRNFMKKRTLAKVEVRRPNPKLNSLIPPQGINLIFSDGSSVSIDCCLGVFNGKAEAYLTALPLDASGEILLTSQLKDHNKLRKAKRSKR